MACAPSRSTLVTVCRIGRSIVRDAWRPCVNAAATDGVRSTPSRISTLSETWMGMRKTLADTAIANSAVSSHAAARGVMSEHAGQQFPRDQAHIRVVGAARVEPERSFLERNGDEQIYAACYGEDESGHRHHGDREDHEEPTGVNRVPDPPVWTRGFEFHLLRCG